MRPTIGTVRKIVQSILMMIERIEKKDESVRDRDISFFFYQAMNDLCDCAPVLLKEEEALRTVISLESHLQRYKGKGTQRLTDGYVQLFNRIAYEPEMSSQEYSDDLITKRFQEVADFLLLQVNGKRARTKRAASVREKYWRTLIDIEGRLHICEALKLALVVATDEKAHLAERTGAIGYLLDTWDGNEDDKERVSTIEKIRTNPPSREILFMILDAEVECGIISEMGALVELEDWDEEND